MTKIIRKQSKLKKKEEPAFWGKSVSLDVRDCDADKIRNILQIQSYVAKLIKLLGMKAYGECNVIHFGEDDRVAGFSFTQLIETSLISGHFVNQTNNAFIDIFSCKDYDPQVVTNFTLEFFNAAEATTHISLRK